jgi:RNA polymerase-binding transcription factor
MRILRRGGYRRAVRGVEAAYSAGMDVAERIAVQRGEVAASIEALARRHAEIVDGSQFSANDDEHDPEGATVAFERAQVAALLRQARDELLRLDLAAERVKDGTYGRCERCGGMIGDGRLEALPAAVTCIDCA